MKNHICSPGPPSCGSPPATGVLGSQDKWLHMIDWAPGFLSFQRRWAPVARRSSCPRCTEQRTIFPWTWGGDAPSPQLPKASVALRSCHPALEMKSVCRADVIFFFSFLLLWVHFLSFSPCFTGAWGLERWTQGLGSASKMSWGGLLHQLCPAWWSGQGGTLGDSWSPQVMGWGHGYLCTGIVGHWEGCHW